MRPILALAIKDLRLLLRDRAGVFFTFFFPLIIAVFFGVIFSGSTREDPTMSLLLVDQDASRASRAFVRRLEQAEHFRIVERSEVEEARELVRRGSVPAVVILPPDFGADLSSPFASGGAEARLLVDPSRTAEAAMIRGALLEAAFAQLQEELTDPASLRRMLGDARAVLDDAEGIDPPFRAALRVFLPAAERFADSLEQQEQSGPTPAEPSGPQAQNRPDPSENADAEPAAFTPIRIDSTAVTRRQREGPPNYYAISFAQGALWSVIGATAGFAVSLVVERARGTLVRLRLAPITAAHILAGKALACYATVVLSMILLFILAAAFFGVRPDSPALLLLSIACIGVCFVGLMMLLSTLGRTEAAASGVGWAVLLLMAMVGGAMIPVFLMPDWLQTVGDFSPVSWSIRALEGAVWRGDTLSQMLRPLGVLLAIGVGAFALGAAIFARRVPT